MDKPRRENAFMNELEKQLAEATKGIDLTDDEKRLLHWIAGWDAWTVETTCRIIEKCRKEVPIEPRC